jgi:transketolase C-terminal domain/subunit
MVSDGELEEGQVWEAALFAAHHRLDRLVVLLDANNSQADGPVDSITTIKPLDSATVLSAAAGARLAVTAENHSVIGGLGSAVAETIAEAGLGRPLRRIGLRDTFAEG